eukprot:scaffold5109_cov36-Attheya_sp.AAC.2
MGSVDIRKLDINDDNERWSFCSKILINWIHMQLLCHLKSVMDRTKFWDPLAFEDWTDQFEILSLSPDAMGTKILINGDLVLRGKRIVTIERIEHPVDSLHPEFQSHWCEE